MWTLLRRRAWRQPGSGLVPGQVGGRFLEELEQEKEELFGRFNRDEIEKATIEAGWKILTGKGSTEYGIGAAAASLIQAILTDSRRVLPCSWTI